MDVALLCHFLKEKNYTLQKLINPPAQGADKFLQFQKPSKTLDGDFFEAD